MSIKYTIFNTTQGYFGLLACEKGLIRTVLPAKDKLTVKKTLCIGYGTAVEDQTHNKPITDWIKAYYAGNAAQKCPQFKIYAPQVTAFTLSVWQEIAKIPKGQTRTYTQLAQKIKRPAACRAVATACGKNPLVLLIPCHRVIRTDGSLGGFSAPGGIKLKAQMLKRENSNFAI